MNRSSTNLKLKLNTNSLIMEQDNPFIHLQLDQSSPCGVYQKNQKKNKITSPKPILPQNCIKCKQSKAQYILNSQHLCKNCQIRMVQYKTRLNLNKALKNDKTLLIGLSGGISSLALCQIIQNLASRDKKFNHAQIIHVNEYCVINEKCPLKELPFKLKLNIIDLLNEQEIEKQGKIFKNIEQECVNDYARNIKYNKMKEYASKLNARLLLADMGQRVAIGVLENVVKGRGVDLEQFTKNKVTVRPMKDISYKQIQIYFNSFNLSEYYFPPPSFYSQNKFTNPTISSTLQSFVCRLQSQYSHTCPTINRTIQKIKIQSDYKQKCEICQGKSQKRICRKCIEFSKMYNQKIL